MEAVAVTVSAAAPAAPTITILDEKAKETAASKKTARKKFVEQFCFFEEEETVDF